MCASKWERGRGRQGRQPEENGGKKRREKSNANFSFKFSTVGGDDTRESEKKMIFLTESQIEKKEKED